MKDKYPVGVPGKLSVNGATFDINTFSLGLKAVEIDVNGLEWQACNVKAELEVLLVGHCSAVKLRGNLVLDPGGIYTFLLSDVPEAFQRYLKDVPAFMRRKIVHRWFE